MCNCFGYGIFRVSVGFGYSLFWVQVMLGMELILGTSWFLVRAVLDTIDLGTSYIGYKLFWV